MKHIELVCASPQMKQVAEKVRMSRGRTLLLTGETGVGKDVLARWAHTISPYADGPFICINCAAIQDPLWESEIFGHTRGAFTGAIKDKPGQIESAEGGSLFLNEIGDMPLSTQSKLLTFLDTREYQRVGDTEIRSVKTRVIAATNRDLKGAIETGHFRRDLFYRLANVHVHIPPLCERPDDVLVLATFHLQELVRQAADVENVRLTDSAIEMLVKQPWKGNVRELHSTIEIAFERCIEAGQKMLRPVHFMPELCDPGPVIGEKGLRAERVPIVEGQVSHTRETDINRMPQFEYRRSFHIPDINLPQEPIFKNLQSLKQFLDQLKTPSGRWNISAAHKVLLENGCINIGRRAFAHRIKQLFPDD